MNSRIAVFILLALLLVAVPAAEAQRFPGVVDRSLFTDKQAFNEGDIVTVLLVEETQGTNETNTRTKSDTRLNTDVISTGQMLGFGINSLGLEGQARNDNESSGVTKSSGQLRGEMSVVVLEVQENGLLSIQGERLLNVNGEKQLMTLQGVIRPEDVSADNTIFSYSIANAQISYSGKGMVTSAGKPGFFTRLWNWIF
ncbi:hypothetical protein GF324_05005 [bacterium]|nr:hypothetical protein [bacterium]